MLRLGLATRMILAIAVVVSAVAAVSFYLQSEILEQSFARKEIDRANSPRLLIQAEIADQIERVQALAGLLRLNNDLIAAAALGESPQATQQLKRVLEPFQKVLNVKMLAVVNANSKTSHYSGGAELARDVSTIWGVAEALSGLESVVTSAGPSGLQIYVVAPLGDQPTNASALILGIVVDQSFLKRISKETGTRIAMVDVNARVLASYADDKVPIVIDAAQVTASLRLKNEVHPALAQAGLTTVYFADTVLDQTLVWVVTVDSRDAIAERQRQQLKAFLAAVAAGLSGALVLGILVHHHAKRILAVKQKAEQAVHQMVATDVVRPVNSVERVSEIESLAASLDVMTASWVTHSQLLTSARIDLAAANADLEEKVTARTAKVIDGELRYRILVEHSIDLILLCDAERSILYANPAMLHAIQCEDPQDLMGCSIETLFEAEDQARLMTDSSSLLQSPGHLSLEGMHVVVRGGGLITVDINTTSYFDAGRLRLQLILHDVTRQRGYELTLRDQLAFIDQLVEAIPLPVSVRDERSKFLRINQAFERTYQCTRADVISRSVFDVLPYELAFLVSENDQFAANSLEAISYNNPLSLNGQAVRHLSARACAIRRSDGSLIGVITIEADLTQLRQQELELRDANAQLGKLSQHLMHAQENERRRIARDLHDQVGQILTALKISLRSLAKRTVVLPESLAQPVSLVDEVLNHTRSLTQSLHPHILENLGLEAAVRSLLERYVKPGGQRFHLSTLVALERSAPAHELVAYRIIQESITNAMRHANAKNLEIVLDMKDDAACIAVMDDGTGFDRTTAQADRRRSPALGIASMRERVEEIGGELSISSQLGKGTVVNIVLPWKNLPSL